jgi:hypothetical protein
MTREEYIKLLHNDPTFKAVLEVAKSDKERRFVQAFAEEFLLSVAGVVEGIRAEAERDPDGFRKRLLEADEELLSEGKSDSQAK